MVEEKVQVIPEIAEGGEEHHVTESPAEMGETLGSNQSQEIRMTNSQLLNEQREVIPSKPKFSRNRLILLGLVLALLLSTIAYFGFKGTAVVKKPAKQKKAETSKGTRGVK